MQITITKETVETIEVDGPVYYRDVNCPFYYNISEDGTLITVGPQIIHRSDPANSSYNKTLQSIVTSGAPSTKEEFDNMLRQALDKILLKADSGILVIK